MQTAPTHVLIVDDEPDISNLIDKALSQVGLKCQAVNDSHEAKHLLEGGSFRILIADIVMPEISGLDLLEYTHQHLPDCKVILVTGWNETRDLAHAIYLGADDYLTKPFNIDELIESVFEAISFGDEQSQHLSLKAARAIQKNNTLKHVSLETIQALVKAVEAKDPYTRKHSEQVAHYAVELAHYTQQPDRMVEAIRVASLLHDVGKIGVPDSVLTKPGPLSDEEFELIRQHPLLGAQILRNISVFTNEATLVLHHHESWDGSGYPQGLTGEQALLGARLIHLADCIDAMLMERTYKQAYTVEKVLEELVRGIGREFDPQLTPAAIDWMQSHPEKLILCPVTV